jgi:hypothetical protein
LISLLPYILFIYVMGAPVLDSSYCFLLCYTLLAYVLAAAHERSQLLYMCIWLLHRLLLLLLSVCCVGQFTVLAPVPIKGLQV